MLQSPTITKDNSMFFYRSPRKRYNIFPSSSSLSEFILESLENLNNEYDFLNPREIITFLESHTDLVRYLESASTKIKEIVNKDLRKISIELEKDPEEEKNVLFLTIFIKGDLNKEEEVNDKVFEQWYVNLPANIRKVLAYRVRGNEF